MQRTPLITLLQNYHPEYPEEIQAKKEMLAFIQKEPHCFERSLEIGHMTASCWLVNQDQTKALLMHHAKLDFWMQLGGHADGDPDLLRVALKEAEEESGLTEISPLSEEIFDIDIHLIPENPKEKAHYHYDVRFLLQARGSQEVIPNRESKGLLWIEKGAQELPTKEHTVLRMFEKWKHL